MRSIRHVILLVLITTLAVPAVADELCFSPVYTAVWTDDPFPVHIVVDSGIDSLMGYNISVLINGDPCVKVLGVIEGTLPGSNGDPTFFRWLNPWEADSISVNGSVLGTVVDGPGTLFTIYFQALPYPGVATLDFNGTILRDGVNANIPHTHCGGAEIEVLEAIGTEQRTWGAVKALYRKP